MLYFIYTLALGADGTFWARFIKCIVPHRDLLYIWQPRGSINIKHNKNKNYIIITKNNRLLSYIW